MTDIEQKLKIHRFVESVKQQEFPFDTHDVEEDLDEILKYYRSDCVFAEEDKIRLKDELAKLAEDEQTREIERAILEVKYPILADIKQKRALWRMRKW